MIAQQVRTYVCVYVRIYVCIRIHMYVRMVYDVSTCMYSLCTYVHISKHVRMWINGWLEMLITASFDPPFILINFSNVCRYCPSSEQSWLT